MTGPLATPRWFLGHDQQGLGTNLESGFASAFVPHLWVTDAAGCKETMPLAVQFWRDRYGQVVASFGLRWAIATRIE